MQPKLFHAFRDQLCLEKKQKLLCICSHCGLLFPPQLKDQNFFLSVFRHGKVSIYFNIFFRFNTQVQPYLSKEFTDDIYKSSVITSGLKNEFCELRCIIVFLFSFFFFLVFQWTMCLSFPAVLLRYLQLSETALKLKSIWFGHYTFLFFRKMPLPPQKLFEQWNWHTFVISCNNECCPAHLKWENLPTSLKRIRSSTIKVLCYQLWATKSQPRPAREQPVRNDTAFSCFCTAHLVCTFTLHLLIHQCHHIKHKHCLTSIYWQQQHSSVPRLLTTLCYILPAFLQGQTPDGAE